MVVMEWCRRRDKYKQIRFFYIKHTFDATQMRLDKEHRNNGEYIFGLGDEGDNWQLW